MLVQQEEGKMAITFIGSSNSIEVAKGLRDDLLPAESIKDSWRDVPNKPGQPDDKDSLRSSVGQHDVAACHKIVRFDVDYLEEFETADDCFLFVPPNGRKIRMEYNAFMGSRNLQYA
jgi:hypothetical protein